MTLSLVLDEIRHNVLGILEDMGASGTEFAVEPARPGFGDVTCNVAFLLSKRLRCPPLQIAEDISARYVGLGGELVSSVEAHPSGYLNFTVDVGRLADLVIRGSMSEDYGSVDVGGASKIIVEHTSVNPNKALHIGHVRNIVIGDTISRILRKANYDVSVLNYVDDSGLQVADVVLGFTRMGFSHEPVGDTKFDHYCGQVYAKTTAEYDKRPELKQTRDDILKEIEEGDSETAVLADSVTKRVLDCQLRTCWNLAVYYDCLNYESQIIRSGLWARIFENLKSMGLIEFEGQGKNAGCWVIRGGRDEEDKVVVRSNGTATYIAKDIPYAAWKLGLVEDPFRYAEYSTSKQPSGRILWQTTLGEEGMRMDGMRGGLALTVIDSRQSRLQKIVAALMDGFASRSGAYVHLGYESVTLSPDTAESLGVQTGGRQASMSGRKGIHVNADTVYDMLIKRSSAETKKRNPNMPDAQVSDIARTVSVGTLRYEMIRQDLDKVISFDLTKSLSLEGDTAPYIQYTYARASRILERAGSEPNLDADYSLLQGQYERELIMQLGLFGVAVGDAARNLSPKVVARYCHNLAVVFNSFYEHVKVLDSGDAVLTNARLCLVLSFAHTLGNALDLVGIGAPDRM